jgi:Phage integrase family
MDEKSGRVSGRLGHFSKTDVRFWQDRLFRETYRSNGLLCETSHWSARLQHEGRRERFPLYTPNKAAAAAKARDIYLFLAANGWEATLARYRKPRGIVQETKNERPVTVGDFLDEAFRTASNQRTVEGYAKAFRQIVSQSFGLATATDKYDHRHGGRSKWLEKVHSVKLAEMTPARVQEWKRSFLAAAGTDPLELRRARISVNSLLRQARSLFAAKRIRHLQLSLPNPLPFDGVDFEPRQSMKYRSEIDIAALVKTAKAELRDSLPEAYKVFLLAVGAGLRKKEIDLLEWSSFRWEENVIRIQATRYFHPKSEDSIADLPVDREVLALFRGYYERAKGAFVIKSRRPPLPSKPRQYYRCEPTFEQVNVWLRKQGVNGSKPLHTLRKEYGSLLTRSYGIHAASRALRHADLRTTSEHYSDSTARVTPGIGRLLANPKRAKGAPKTSRPK